MRDPGFVGQVHACPNCGSMVQIVAPVSKQDQESHEARVDSNQPDLTKPIFLGLSDSLVADEFSYTEPEEQQAEKLLGESEYPAEPVEEELTPTKLHVAAGPLIGLTLGMIAAGSITLFALWPSDNLVAQAVEEEIAKPTTTAETGIELTEQELSVETTDQTQTVQVNKPAIDAGIKAEPIETTVDVSTNPGSNTKSKASDQAAVEPLPIDPSPVAQLPVDQTPTKELPADEPTVRVAMKTDPAINDRPAPKFDPLDYDPTSIDMVLHSKTKDSELEEPAIDQIALLPPNERRTQADQFLPARPKSDAKQAISVSLISNGPEFDSKQESSAAERLAMPIPKIDLKKIPLATAINLLSELSGAPITLDPISLKQAGIDARRKVNVNGEGISLGEVLSATLKTVRLEYQAAGSDVVTFRPGVEKSQSTTHKLADLVGSNVSVLESLLTQIGPSAIAAKGIEISDNGTLMVDAPRGEQYELILLTERLRLARGLQPQSKYPRRLLSSEPVFAQLATALEHRTTFSFVTPTSLRQVLEHWSQATGLTILVDWQSLAEVDLNPQSLLTASANQRTWIEALDGILEPLGAAWSPVDRQTIWISTSERNANSESVEFYPGLSEAQSGILSREQPQAKVAYDAASRSTIVRGNSAAQRSAYALWLQK